MMGLGEVDHGNLFSWVFRISLPCENAAGGNDNIVQHGQNGPWAKNGGFFPFFISISNWAPVPWGVDLDQKDYFSDGTVLSMKQQAYRCPIEISTTTPHGSRVD